MNNPLLSSNFMRYRVLLLKGCNVTDVESNKKNPQSQDLKMSRQVYYITEADIHSLELKLTTRIHQEAFFV